MQQTIERKENWHEDFIINLAAQFRPKVYVELGLYQCELFNGVIPYAETLIGVDISEEYCQIAEERLRNIVAQQKLHTY